MIPTSGFGVQLIPTVSITRRTMFCNSGHSTLITDRRSRSALISQLNRNVMQKCLSLNEDPNILSTLIMASFPKRSLNVRRTIRRCMTNSEHGSVEDVSGICIKIPFETPLPNHGRDISVTHVLKGSVSAKPEDRGSYQFRN
jgi:hypothetical protein